jgi:hypothetical protein
MKGRTFNNERGAILVIALIFVCILAIAGSMAYRMTASELMIAKNFDSSKEALYSANAGLEEARAALGLPSTDPPGTAPYGNAIYDPAVSSTSTPPYPDPNWTAYIVATSAWGLSDDPDYHYADTSYIPNSSSQTNTSITTNSLQSDLEYWVKIRHKTEYDAEQQGHTTSNPLYDDDDGNTTGGHSPTDRGSVIVYGYPDGSLTAQAFTPSGGTPYRPVDIITAYGIGENSKTTIQTEVAHDPGPPILAALYAEATSYSGVEGDAVNYTIDIDGADHCTAGECPFCGNVGKSDIYVYPSTADPLLDDTDYNPTPPGPIVPLPTIELGDLNINVNQGVTLLRVWENSSTPSGCYNTDYKICSSASNVTITDQDGTGILLVQGNLTLEGGSVVETTWKGLIFVTGELTLNGGGGGSSGGLKIEGAVLVNGEVWINAANEGPVTIHYNSCAVDAALNSIPMKILSWEDLSITQ